MAYVIKHRGTRDRRGKFIPDNPVAFQMEFERVKEGTRLVVTVKRERKERSDPENRYYWGVVVDMIAEEIGLTKDEVHEMLKQNLLKFKKYIPFKKNAKNLLIETDFVKSTTELSTVEFEEYLERCRMWAAEKLGCIIPLPNEIDLDY